MEQKTQEFFEANDDAVDNFDTLNDVYRNTWDWIVIILLYKFYLLILLISRKLLTNVARGPY